MTVERPREQSKAVRPVRSSGRRLTAATHFRPVSWPNEPWWESPDGGRRRSVATAATPVATDGHPASLVPADRPGTGGAS